MRVEFLLLQLDRQISRAHHFLEQRCTLRSVIASIVTKLGQKQNKRWAAHGIHRQRLTWCKTCCSPASSSNCKCIVATRFWLECRQQWTIRALRTPSKRNICKPPTSDTWNMERLVSNPKENDAKTTAQITTHLLQTPNQLGSQIAREFLQQDLARLEANKREKTIRQSSCNRNGFTHDINAIDHHAPAASMGTRST